MKRAIRRHQQAVAKARRIRILKAYGAYKTRLSVWDGAIQDWTWIPKDWEPIGRLVMNDPGWYVHEFNIVPPRVRSKRLERQIEKGVDPDRCCWPDYKKPYNYYW